MENAKINAGNALANTEIEIPTTNCLCPPVKVCSSNNNIINFNDTVNPNAISVR